MIFKKSAMSYKKTHAYLSTSIPIFAKTHPKRYAHFVHYCGNEKWAIKGITNGDGPIVTIRNLAELDKDNPIGLFVYSMDHTIFIHSSCARKYETDPSKYEIGLQYLVLHELIHWARHKGGESHKVSGSPSRPLKGGRSGEPGDEFEAHAYGRDMSRVWNEGAKSFDRPK